MKYFLTLFLVFGFVFGMMGSFGYAQENFPALNNLGFQTSWTNGSQVPGWDYLPFVVTGGTGDPRRVADGDDAITFGGASNFNLKFEIDQIGSKTVTCFKEVNWGTVTSVTATAQLAVNVWGGGNAGSFVGVGIDPDGAATSWASTTARATITSASPNKLVVNVKTPVVSKPGGATTFTVVLYCERVGNYFNAHMDNIGIDPNVNFAVPPSTPVLTSGTHAASVWSRNNTPSFSYQTTNATMYSYVLDSVSNTVPDQVSDDTTGAYIAPAQSNYDVNNGLYFHVLAGNAYGWSGASHFGPIWIDAADPVVQNVTWTLATGGGVRVTADVSDTGGSPFDISDIEMVGPEETVNGDAEAGNLSSWTSSGGIGMDSLVYTGGSHSGAHHFSCSIGNGDIDSTMYQQITVVPGVVYRASLFTAIGAETGNTSAMTLSWVDGVYGGSAQIVSNLSYTDGGSNGWVFMGGEISPSGSTVTLILHFTGTGPGIKGIHADDISLLQYFGNPNTWTGGVATWLQEPGQNGDVLTISAVDGAGNQDSADSTALSGVLPISASGVGARLWNLFK